VTPIVGTEKPAVAAMPDAPTSGGSPAGRRRGREARTELAAGAVLVGATAVGGLWFALRPGSGKIDGWLLDLVGASRSRWFIDITNLHHPWVIVLGAVVAAAVTFPRDRPRSLACLVGPPLALLVCELVFKPLVGRTLGGSLSYPSGSTVGAAALAVVAVLATPPRWRPLTAVIGAAYAVWMTVAVVALGWHYPTDALAGLAFGVGVVLLADGASWLVFGRRVRVQGRPFGPSTAPVSSASSSSLSSRFRAILSSR
jgi:membrane-associated phospholipid phosphatase